MLKLLEVGLMPQAAWLSAREWAAAFWQQQAQAQRQRLRLCPWARALQQVPHQVQWCCLSWAPCSQPAAGQVLTGQLAKKSLPWPQSTQQAQLRW